MAKIHPNYTKYPGFYNKNGDLTYFAFACGYYQKYETKTESVELEKDGCFHVKRYVESPDHNHEVIKRVEWLTFDSDDLTSARKAYRKILAEIKKSEKRQE